MISLHCLFHVTCHITRMRREFLVWCSLKKCASKLASSPKKFATLRFGNAFQLRLEVRQLRRSIRSTVYGQEGRRISGCVAELPHGRDSKLPVVRYTRPSGAFTLRPRVARARSGRVVARNGICVAPGRSRPHCRRHRDHPLSLTQCPPSLVARRRPPSAVRRPPTRPSLKSRVATPPRRATRVSFLGILARRTLPTRPAEVDNPRGSSNFLTECIAPVSGRSVDRHAFGPFGTETNLFIVNNKFQFPYLGRKWRARDERGMK